MPDETTAVAEARAALWAAVLEGGPSWQLNTPRREHLQRSVQALIDFEVAAVRASERGERLTHLYTVITVAADMAEEAQAHLSGSPEAIVRALKLYLRQSLKGRESPTQASERKQEYELGEDVTDQFTVAKEPGMVISARFTRAQAEQLFDAVGEGSVVEFVRDAALRAAGGGVAS